MKKSAILFLHLSFWILISCMFYGLFATLVDGYLRINPDGIEFVKTIIVTIVTMSVAVFYISYFTALFFIRNKKRLFILIGSIFILAIIYCLKTIFINNNSAYLYNAITLFTPPMAIAFIAFTFRTAINLWEESLKKAKLEKEKFHAQLELLKAKLNPHFLFNSLNNIDVLIEENPKSASEYLTKLSDILRYVLYEAKENDTLLVNELGQIKSYVELEKIRTDNPHFVNLSIKGEIGNQKIAPMIFVPFIENAFKHSKNKSVENAIQIEFDIHPDHIKMVCKNHYDPTHTEILKNDGIGIYVMKQRLNLLYPENHELSIDKSGQWFIVTLIIKFKNEN